MKINRTSMQNKSFISFSSSFLLYITHDDSSETCNAHALRHAAGIGIGCKCADANAVELTAFDLRDARIESLRAKLCRDGAGARADAESSELHSVIAALRPCGIATYAVGARRRSWNGSRLRACRVGTLHWRCARRLRSLSWL